MSYLSPANYLRANRIWLSLLTFLFVGAAFGQNTDFAYGLLAEGKLIRAKKELQLVALENPENVEALLALAWVEHWLGFEKNAEQHAQQVLNLQVENKEAIYLLEEINAYRRPLLYLSEEFQSDDQPMDRWNTAAGLSWYRSNLLNLKLEINQLSFQHDSSNSALQVQFQNTFFEAYSRINITGGVGLYSAQENELLWRLQAGRKLSELFYLQASLIKMPYFSTLSSVQLPFATLILKKEIALTLNRNDKWLGKAVLESNQFAKDEAVNTQFAWLLAPIIHTKKLKLGVGYAFSHSHSDSLTFIPKVNQGGQFIPNPDGGLVGVYNPYFSPKNQSVHWALISLEIPLKELVKWKTRFSYGAFAKADNPYLYEDLDSSGELFINFGYTDERYYPLEFESALTFSIGKSLELQAGYFYQSLFFYKAQGGRIELKYRLGK